MYKYSIVHSSIQSKLDLHEMRMCVVASPLSDQLECISIVVA